MLRFPTPIAPRTISVVGQTTGVKRVYLLLTLKVLLLLSVHYQASVLPVGLIQQWWGLRISCAEAVPLAARLAVVPAIAWPPASGLPGQRNCRGCLPASDPAPRPTARPGVPQAACVGSPVLALILHTLSDAPAAIADQLCPSPLKVGPPPTRRRPAACSPAACHAGNCAVLSPAAHSPACPPHRPPTAERPAAARSAAPPPRAPPHGCSAPPRSPLSQCGSPAT